MRTKHRNRFLAAALSVIMLLSLMVAPVSAATPLGGEPAAETPADGSGAAPEADRDAVSLKESADLSDTTAVTAGTYYFSTYKHQGATGTKVEWDAVTGVEFTSGFTADSSNHGPQAASGGTMTISIPEGQYSNLVVTTCTYGGGGDTITASSGTVDIVTGADAQSDGNDAKAVFVYNATGTTTITFSGNTYVHGLTVGEFSTTETELTPKVVLASAEVITRVGTSPAPTLAASVKFGTATDWSVSSDTEAVATATVTDGTVTISPVAVGKATITVTATVDTVAYNAAATVYVAPAEVGELTTATYNFVVSSDNDGKLKFNTGTTGMEWTGIAMGQNPDHGAYGAKDSTLKVYVPTGKLADLEITTCQYGSGASITATSGTVGTASGTDPVTPITGVSGETTITFGSNVYVHGIAVTLRDANSASLTVDPATVTMRAGESKDVTVEAKNFAEGMSAFAISSDATKATAELAADGSKVTIAGVAEGTATVYVGMAETAPADAEAAAAVEGVKTVAVTVNAALPEGTREWVWGGSDGSHSLATFEADSEGLKLPEGNKTEDGKYTAVYYHNNYGLIAKPKMAADGTTIEVPATIGIPVDGPSTITVKVGYTWDIMLGDAQVADRYGRESAVSGDNGSEQAKTFDYYGNAGYVTLTAAETTSTYIYSIQVVPKTGVDPVPKVAVWDLNGTQLDETIFDNKLNVDTINGFYGDPVPNPPTLGSFATADGEFAFVGDEGRTDYRLRTANEALLVHSTNNHTKNNVAAGEDTYDPTLTAYGVSFQSNGGKMTFQFKASAGDKLTFTYADASTTGATVNMNYLDAADNGAVTKTLGRSGTSNGNIASVYVKGDGIQTLTNFVKEDGTVSKIGVSRFYRETPTKVTISGSLTVGEGVAEGYKLIATDNASGAIYEATVSEGTYSVEVNNYLSGTDFTFSVTDAEGCIVAQGAEVSVPAGADAVSNNVAVIKVDLVSVSGTVTGLETADLANVELTMSTTDAGKIYVPKIDLDRTTGAYTVNLEKDVNYTLSAANVEDYTLSTTTMTKSAAEENVAIAFEAKPTYAITVTADPATVDLSAATLTFTKVKTDGTVDADDAHPKGYVYTFTGVDAIQLRDGQYKVKVEGAAYSPKLISDLKVDGEAASKVIPFQVETATKWVFTAADFTADVVAAKNFNGLLLDGTVAREEKDHAILKDTGKMSIPVSGPCRIDVTVYYESAATIGTDAVPVVLVQGDAAWHTTGTKQTFSYDYAGEAGYVDLAATGTTYVTQIEVVEITPYKATLTVGTDKDYQTIQDAVDAVAKMERPNNERVTIVIDPGNYEEMVWVKSPNVTFKNASETPSLALSNGGKDIDATNAVRITWYYGCGFDYYSMGPNSKFNAEQFAVNQANGYVSHPNSSGGGSNNECWWNATTVIAAEGFRAEGIIFENSFNQYVSAAAAADTIVPNDGAKQDASKPRADLAEGSTEVQRKAYVERAAAIALANYVASDAFFDHCAFVGHQDVIYGGWNVKAGFYDCDVFGACDYIFGPMTAVFAKCDLVLNVGADADANDVAYIGAPQNGADVHGYLMYNCNVRAVEPTTEMSGTTKTAVQHCFGRAWGGATAEAIFYETTVGTNASGKSLIGPDGWNTGLGSSTLCAEYHTHEEDTTADHTKRIFGGVLATPTTTSGAPIADYIAWLDGWNPFEGKAMAVNCPDKADVEGIALTDGEAAAEASYTLEATDSKALTVTVTPEGAEQDFIATSSSEAVTAVKGTDGKLLITAVDGTGETPATVTVTSVGADSTGAAKSVTVSVTVKAPVTEVTVTDGEAAAKEVTYGAGASIDLTAAVAPETADQTVTWAVDETAAAAGITVTPDATDATKATVAVPATAASGEYTVTATSVAKGKDGAGVAGTYTITVSPEAKAKIVILHSNDVHGAIDGYAKMAQLKADYEAEGVGKVLVVDAGDFSQGTVYVSTSQGATAVELMDLVGYDLTTAGNHEFDYGAANLDSLFGTDTKVKLLAANIQKDGAAAYESSAVIDVDGVKLGFFGLATPETATKAHPAKIQGLSFLAGDDLATCAQAQVDALKADGADYVICLSHLGIDDESEPNRSIDLLGKVTGIDVLIDGHSHSTLDAIVEATGAERKVGDTVVTSTGTAFANIGVITIDTAGKTIETKCVAADTITLDETNEAVKAVADRAAAIKAEIDAAYGEKFAESLVDLNGARDPGNRTEETNLGDLITDAMLWLATKDDLGVDADKIVALTNGGGIRAAIAKGDVTKKDVNTVLPFGNTVAVAYVTGDVLLEALEASTYCTPTAIGGFPQVSGIVFTVDTTKEFDAGDNYPGTTYAKPNSINRVTIQSVNGKAFDPAATYAVVTNDFVAAGGDTYYALSASGTVTDTGIPLDEALMDYITTVLNGVVGEDYAAPQGRITVLTAESGGDDSGATAPKRTTSGTSTPTAIKVTTTNENGDVTTTVTQPNGDREITVTNAEGEVVAEISLPATISAPATRFVDVPEGHWAESSINNMAAMGMVKGVNEEQTIFDMNSSMTRGAVATIFFRLSNGKEGNTATFADVAADAWYADAVGWAAKTGVVNGYSAEAFGPDDSITRQQLAVMLCRFANLVGVDTKTSGTGLSAFTDGDQVDDWAVDGMAWCVKNGIMKGRGDDTLDPTANITRAESAAMFDRMIALLKK